MRMSDKAVASIESDEAPMLDGQPALLIIGSAEECASTQTKEQGDQDEVANLLNSVWKKAMQRNICMKRGRFVKTETFPCANALPRKRGCRLHSSQCLRTCCMGGSSIIM
jgi:hypothetical protein